MMPPPNLLEVSKMKTSIKKCLLTPQYDTNKDTFNFSSKCQNELTAIDLGQNIFLGIIIIFISILEVNNAERKKYNDYNIGPKYDNEGNVIRWTILGKPEQFSRAQNLKKKAV